MGAFDPEDSKARARTPLLAPFAPWEWFVAGTDGGGRGGRRPPPVTAVDQIVKGVDGGLGRSLGRVPGQIDVARVQRDAERRLALAKSRLSWAMLVP